MSFTWGVTKIGARSSWHHCNIIAMRTAWLMALRGKNTARWALITYMGSSTNKVSSNSSTRANLIRMPTINSNSTRWSLWQGILSGSAPGYLSCIAQSWFGQDLVHLGAPSIADQYFPGIQQRTCSGLDFCWTFCGLFTCFGKDSVTPNS